ncbi:hypothetical protein M9H77_05112 [Catharanthus roseus]|uniref:Uncharacterized protein n=1 Tax=Catharanthus roseus TaxID=4058 RepID=A0ACC0CFZ1_CATRO|nr:hypothetical protein M9H77_05112 [Catharanthus roseus]
MQDQRMLSPEQSLVPKSRKKKASKKGESVKKVQELGALPFQVMQKPSKRGLVNIPPTVFQPQDKSTSESLPDSSPSPSCETGYRALRRKYLLLEEESFGLGKELQDVEDEINTLEGEKLALLDELVVLEGLVDPSEMLSSQGNLLK